MYHRAYLTDDIKSKLEFAHPQHDHFNIAFLRVVSGENLNVANKTYLLHFEFNGKSRFTHFVIPKLSLVDERDGYYFYEGNSLPLTMCRTKEKNYSILFTQFEPHINVEYIDVCLNGTK